MTAWHGVLFRETEEFWENLRRFTYYNRTVLEVLFILLYAVEQVLLIAFTFTISNPRELSLVISLFAVLVLTTFTLHKLIMESRIKFLEREVQDLQKEKFIGEQHAKSVQKEMEKLMDTTYYRKI